MYKRQTIKDYRRTIALYEEIAPMLRANLYERGHDAAGDRSIELYPQLDTFVSEPNKAQIPQAFKHLQGLLNSKPGEAAAKS